MDGAKQNSIRNTGKWVQILFHVGLKSCERCSVVNKTNRGVMFFTQSHSVSYDCHVDWPWLQGPSPRDCGRGAQNLWLKSSKDSDIKALEIMQAWRHKHRCELFSQSYSYLWMVQVYFLYRRVCLYMKCVWSLKYSVIEGLNYSSGVQIRS